MDFAQYMDTMRLVVITLLHQTNFGDLPCRYSIHVRCFYADSGKKRQSSMLLLAVELESSSHVAGA